MASDPSAPKLARSGPSKDRRRAAAEPPRKRSWGTVKALLVRPFGLQRVDGRLRLAFVERRVAVADELSATLEMLDDALRAWLLSRQHEAAARVMRHLLVVHDELGRGGWPAVEALPSAVLGKAVVQLEMLAGGVQGPTPLRSGLVDRLRAVKVAAELREESAQRVAPRPVADSVVISEVPHEAFEEAERDWDGRTRPPAGQGDEPR